MVGFALPLLLEINEESNLFGMVLRLRYGRTDSTTPTTSQEDKRSENEFLDFIRNEDTEAIHELSKDAAKCLQLSQNWDFIRHCAKLLMAMESTDLIKYVKLTFGFFYC